VRVRPPDACVPCWKHLHPLFFLWPAMLQGRTKSHSEQAEGMYSTCSDGCRADAGPSALLAAGGGASGASFRPTLPTIPAGCWSGMACSDRMAEQGDAAWSALLAAGLAAEASSRSDLQRPPRAQAANRRRAPLQPRRTCTKRRRVAPHPLHPQAAAAASASCSAPAGHTNDARRAAPPVQTPATRSMLTWQAEEPRRTAGSASCTLASQASLDSTAALHHGPRWLGGCVSINCTHACPASRLAAARQRRQSQLPCSF
jgi:hypothetical protein